MSFNADPNDVGAVPIWSDLTNRLRLVTQLVRGRQYELQETQAAQPAIGLQNTDEYLNPANTASPYWPNVIPNRLCEFQAIWPQSTAGNMLTTAAPVPAQLPNTVDPVLGVFYDGSFESYAVGATVPWLGAVGFEISAPVVSTTTPRSGTQDVTYSVNAAGGVQGTIFAVPCVPGRQYTCSAYVRQTTANTQLLTVTDQTQVVDSFNRTTASGLGTADYGGAWTVSGGTSANYSTTPGATATPWLGSAAQSNAAVNTPHLSTAGSCVDSTQRVLITIPVVATGAEIDIGLMSRFADSSNYYFAELQFNTNHSIGLRIQKRVAGTTTSLNAITLPFTYAAGKQVWLYFSTVGDVLQAWAWPDGAVDPRTTTIALDQSIEALATDTALTAAGAVGLRSVLNASNTNSLPVAATFQTYTATGSVTGSSTTTTGAYVRLSATWTATQPVHTVQVATIPAGALAGVVLVDDVQHEEAASATTFTTSGPVLYNLFRGYADRAPSIWQSNSKGFEGLAPFVLDDAFAPLTRFGMLAAYPAAVQATNPAYWWPLWDEAGAVSFAEITGNGPALGLDYSKYGQGTLPAAGTDMAIIGDPGGTGVTFTPGAVPSSTTQASTILATGPLASTSSTPMLVPPIIGTGWTVSVAAWVNTTTTSGSQTLIMSATVVSATGALYYVPIGMNASGSVFYQNTNGATGFSLLSGAGSTTVTDSLPHLIVGIVTQDATNTTCTKFVDGVQVATATAANATLGGMLGGQGTTILVGGIDDSTSFNNIVAGAVSGVAMWNRALSGTEITNLYQAGTGWAGETSAQRIARYLTGATVNASFGVAPAYTGPVDIDYNALSVMGPDVLATGIDALTACQNVTTTENGTFWAGPYAVTFAGREIRYLEVTPTRVFGENTVGGQFPYQGDIGFDYDLTQVFNPVRITNADGIVAVASNPTFSRRFSPQAYSRDINVADDNEAVDAASYLLDKYKQPTQRVAQISLDPAAYPLLWPVVLSLDIGTRVTVIRVAKAANSGTGLTMSSDYFVEKVSHDSIDFAASEWLVTLQLSPVDQSQVGILDDTTYGLLDLTMILAY